MIYLKMDIDVTNCSKAEVAEMLRDLADQVSSDLTDVEVGVQYLPKIKGFVGFNFRSDDPFDTRELYIAIEEFHQRMMRGK